MRKTGYRTFQRNLILFLLPVLVPLIGLGLFSLVISKHYIEREQTQNNLNLLKQTKENIDFIFNELDMLNLNLSTNIEITGQLKKILNRERPVISYEENKSFKTVLNFISSSANAHPYIQSIYIYLNNPSNRFITSTDGLASLDSYYDTDWFSRNLNFRDRQYFWAEMRRLRRKFEFGTDGQQVISLYRNLNYPNYEGNNGMIVLNIYADYLKEHIENSVIFPGQKIMVVNSDGEVVLSNGPLPQAGEIVRKVNPAMPVTEVKLSGERYIATQLMSEKYDWRYISLIPYAAFYQMPSRIKKMTVFFGMVSFGLGLALTYWLTKRNDTQLQNIISVIKSAETGGVLPDPVFRDKDEYEFITYNIIKTFIEQNYLKVQLSERKYKLRYMELQALQAQINPHFLFNTLETIKWKVIEYTRGENEASRMLVELSDILKYAMESPDQWVSLEQEILHVRNYLDIQKTRYRDKFDVIWEYDDQVLQFPVIRLIMQPVLENAIYHGIKPLERKSLIKIKIRQIGKELLITIINNGLGMSEIELGQLREKLAQDGEYTTHIGLYNTHKRLKLSYGEEYGIKIRSKENLGTVVYLRIPALPSST